MDGGPFIVFAILMLALAVYNGLLAVATAITKLRLSQIDLRLPDQINVSHRSNNGTPT